MGIHILSRSGQPFKSREEAGVLLGRELKKFDLVKPLILGIPRGGIVVARSVARELNADMDVVVSRKLRAPESPELAIGAVGEDGNVFLHDWLVSDLDVDKSYIEKEKERQLSEIARRIARYREVLPRIDPLGRDVVITDDGIATGATFLVALSIMRRSGPNRLVAALPVAPEDNLLKLEKDADEVLCLKSPPFFAAVGQFYSHFSQVSDEEAIELLKEERTERDLKSK